MRTVDEVGRLQVTRTVRYEYVVYVDEFSRREVNATDQSITII
jgi:hypothetical protein